MAAFTTAGLVNLPRQIADGMVRETVTNSTVAALSGREPMRFGDVDIVTFNDLPRAEFVGEGEEKASTTGTFGTVTAVPRKAQVTMRFNQEVKWADEDYQLGVLTELSNAGAVALSRALDLGLYHRIQPSTGAELDWANYVGATTNRVAIDAGAQPHEQIEEAVGQVIESNKNVNGVAFDPTYAWTIARSRYSDGRKMYPELGLTTELTAFEGFRASVGNTVSGQPEAADTGTRAIVGDFQAGVRWGIQRQLPVELIEHGDPDGDGDLKRRNQIALRLEIQYAWYVFIDRFSVIEEAA